MPQIQTIDKSTSSRIAGMEGVGILSARLRGPRRAANNRLRAAQAGTEGQNSPCHPRNLRLPTVQRTARPGVEPGYRPCGPCAGAEVRLANPAGGAIARGTCWACPPRFRDAPCICQMVHAEPTGSVGPTLVFEHTALKEAGFKLRESGLIVQALKSLGPDGVTPDVISKIRRWMPRLLLGQSADG